MPIYPAGLALAGFGVFGGAGSVGAVVGNISVQMPPTQRPVLDRAVAARDAQPLATPLVPRCGSLGTVLGETRRAP